MMRRLSSSLVCLSLLCACVADRAVTDTPCSRASTLLASCGIAAPYLDGAECKGPSLLLAGCIVDNATTCDELGRVRFEDCVDDLDLPGISTPLVGP